MIWQTTKVQNHTYRQKESWTHRKRIFAYDVSNIFNLWEDFPVKKIQMARGVTLAFEEGCNKYPEYVVKEI